MRWFLRAQSGSLRVVTLLFAFENALEFMLSVLDTFDERRTKSPARFLACSVQMPREIRERHENYKTMVPNIRRRFHGTYCSSICSFYVGVSRIHSGAYEYMLTVSKTIRWPQWWFILLDRFSCDRGGRTLAWGSMHIVVCAWAGPADVYLSFSTCLGGPYNIIIFLVVF